MLQQGGQMIVHVGMRIALRQQPAERREVRDAVDHVRGSQLRRRVQVQHLDRVMAEVLVEPRPPDHAYGIARLQQRPQPRPASAPHQTEMAAVIARHDLEDGAAFAMPLGPQHDPVVGPFHRACSGGASQRLSSASGSGLRRSCSSSGITKQAGRSAALTLRSVAQRWKTARSCSLR